MLGLLWREVFTQRWTRRSLPWRTLGIVGAAARARVGSTRKKARRERDMRTREMAPHRREDADL